MVERERERESDWKKERKIEIEELCLYIRGGERRGGKEIIYIYIYRERLNITSLYAFLETVYPAQPTVVRVTCSHMRSSQDTYNSRSMAVRRPLEQFAVCLSSLSKLPQSSRASACTRVAAQARQSKEGGEIKWPLNASSSKSIPKLFFSSVYLFISFSLKAKLG